MPKKATVSGSATETDQLMMVMTDRINQAMDRNVQLFRKKHGRVADFASRYGLMRTTANRILQGEVFPPNVLLRKFSHDVGIPIDWFFGGGHFESIDEAFEHRPIEVPIWGERDALFVPPSLLTNHDLTSGPIVAILAKSTAFIPVAGRGDCVLIQRLKEPLNGALHVVQFAGEDAPKLAYITSTLRQDAFEVTPYNGEGSQLFKPPKIACAAEKPPVRGVLVLGTVVGMLCIKRDGYQARDLDTLAQMEMAPQPPKGRRGAKSR